MFYCIMMLWVGVVKAVSIAKATARLQQQIEGYGRVLDERHWKKTQESQGFSKEHKCNLRELLDTYIGAIFWKLEKGI